jgi:hypothetical protein
MTNTTSSRGRTIVLWILAFVLVLAAATWQRRSGPSYPRSGDLELPDGTSVHYALVRSEQSDTDAVVEFPDAASITGVELLFRRHGTRERPSVVAMRRGDENWTATLPRQPAAGKLDYFLHVTAGEHDLRVPVDESDFVVIRFKDPVPAGILIPHIFMMFTGMFCGLRAGLAALLEPGRGRRLTWVTLFCLTVGGLFLGPVVQKYAFGAFWTGWPFGEDLTDNKTLVMWAGWAVAAALVGRRGPLRPRAQTAMIVATLLMLAVYLVPHSLRGSTLDYDALDEGVPVEDAVRTG